MSCCNQASQTRIVWLRCLCESKRKTCHWAQTSVLHKACMLSKKWSLCQSRCCKLACKVASKPEAAKEVRHHGELGPQVQTPGLSSLATEAPNLP